VRLRAALPARHRRITDRHELTLPATPPRKGVRRRLSTITIHGLARACREAQAVEQERGACPAQAAAAPVRPRAVPAGRRGRAAVQRRGARTAAVVDRVRSADREHTSELQSRENVVCRLLLEKKKTKTQ